MYALPQRKNNTVATINKYMKKKQNYALCMHWWHIEVIKYTVDYNQIRETIYRLTNQAIPSIDHRCWIQNFMTEDFQSVRLWLGEGGADAIAMTMTDEFHVVAFDVNKCPFSVHQVHCCVHCQFELRARANEWTAERFSAASAPRKLQSYQPWGRFHLFCLFQQHTAFFISTPLSHTSSNFQDTSQSHLIKLSRNLSVTSG